MSSPTKNCIFPHDLQIRKIQNKNLETKKMVSLQKQTNKKDYKGMNFYTNVKH